MNKDKYIFLAEKYLDGDISDSEKGELLQILEENPELKKEIKEQKKIKGVLKKMALTNPTKEFWDEYWLNIYNKLERKLAWVLISIGAVLLLGFSAYEAISELLKDTAAPPVVKFGLLTLVIGFIVLIVSLLRERVFSVKRDKYKEIQR